MKQRSSFGVYPLVCIFLILIFTSCTQKQNWPQFIGPDGNMLSSVKNLPEVWDTVKNIAWTYKLDGAGWSSPIVWGTGSSPVIYNGVVCICIKAKGNPAPPHLFPRSRNCVSADWRILVSLSFIS